MNLRVKFSSFGPSHDQNFFCKVQSTRGSPFSVKRSRSQVNKIIMEVSSSSNAFVTSINLLPLKTRNRTSSCILGSAVVGSFCTLPRGNHLFSQNSNIKKIQLAMSSSGDIHIIENASEDVIKQKGCRSWPTWGCEASKFPWTYSDSETCLILKGEVTVIPNGGKPVSFKAGDIVTFPAGMSCVWDVKKAVQKHYMFH